MPCARPNGRCDACGVVHFTCPCCEARHDRGYVDGVTTFRCLFCGYVGDGALRGVEVATKRPTLYELVATDPFRSL